MFNKTLGTKSRNISTVKNSKFFGKKFSHLGKIGKKFPNIPSYFPIFTMECNFGLALTSFIFAIFPNFPVMGILTQNGIYFPKWENLGIFGKTWFPVLGFFGKIWEKVFWKVNLWWEILRNFGIFREIIISSLRIFVEILFWDILGNNRKNIPNGKNFSRSVDKMGNLLMRNFGKIWDYSGKLVEVNLWWEILGFFGKSLFPLLWFLLKSRFGIFWEILGNEKLWYCTTAIYWYLL